MTDRRCLRLTALPYAPGRLPPQDTPAGRQAYNDVIDLVNAGHRRDDCTTCHGPRPGGP